ncbi:hypothetical protein [Streptomyces sp. TR02-1]|uniref:hypothetical protein n=1 Tax=Streptomyces sp. TR02-1 TaxID=3385977 RepID=UPI0039A22D16
MSDLLQFGIAAACDDPERAGGLLHALVADVGSREDLPEAALLLAQLIAHCHQISSGLEDGRRAAVAYRKVQGGNHERPVQVAHWVIEAMMRDGRESARAVWCEHIADTGVQARELAHETVRWLLVLAVPYGGFDLAYTGAMLRGMNLVPSSEKDGE